MLFYSPHANFQVICSKTVIKRHHATGEEVDRIPGIWANFGKLGPQYTYTNPETGEEMQGAQIMGHWYDTDLEAAQHGWDAETKQMVETKLLRLCQTQPDRIRFEARDTPKAEKPWPTYDTADAAQVVELAQALGLVEEALAYERENRDRPDVITGLTGTPAAKAEADASDDLPPDPEPVEPSGEKPGQPILRTISV